jgi:hypothetical protein
MLITQQEADRARLVYACFCAQVASGYLPALSQAQALSFWMTYHDVIHDQTHRQYFRRPVLVASTPTVPNNWMDEFYAMPQPGGSVPCAR